MKIFYQILIIPTLALISLILLFILANIGIQKTKTLLFHLEHKDLLTLQSCRELSVILEQIQRSFIDASTAADENKLKEADSLKFIFNKILERHVQDEVFTSDLSETFKSQFENYFSLAMATSKRIISGENSESIFKSITKMQEYYKSTKESIHLAIVKQQELVSKQMNKLTSEQQKSANTNLVIAILFVLLFFSAVIISQKITKSINRIILLMKEISQGDGDLTKRITVESKDELGELVVCFNKFIENIQSIVINIAGSTSVLTDASKELSTVSDDLVNKSEEMTSKSNSVSLTTQTMSKSIHNIANSSTVVSRNSGNVAQAAEQMSLNMNAVSSAVEEMSVSIQDIAHNAEKASEVSSKAVHLASDASTRMSNLGSAAHEIDKVTDVIKRIAEQTNLLALNATIEAASAGEQGKGFAVVANEIKELANQSTQAAEDIAIRIEGVQSSTSQAVSVIHEVTEIINQIGDSVNLITSSVGQQTKASSDISSNITQAATEAKNIATSISEVAHSAVEMSRNSSDAADGAKHVVSIITDVNVAIMDSNKGAQQVHQSALKLSDVSKVLGTLVGRFKVK